MSTDVLRDRDLNLQPQQQATQDSAAKTTDKRRLDAEQPQQQLASRTGLEDRLKDNNYGSLQSEHDPRAYVSPSDAIMSPASKKLSDLKQRHMNKPAPKQRSLFARAVTSRQKDLGPVQQASSE